MRPDPRQITVLPAQPDWAARFATEAALLESLLGPNCIRIHHMGSTAVPGLPAKPIIDILVEVADLGAVDALNPALEQIGYRPQGEKGIAGRRFFQKGGHLRTHHVHAFRLGDPNIARHLAFRDYLLAHPRVAFEYGQLKLSLAAQFRDHPAGYQAAKSDFVLEHEARALAWRARQG